jgi:hypothetical protein
MGQCVLYSLKAPSSNTVTVVIDRSRELQVMHVHTLPTRSKSLIEKPEGSPRGIGKTQEMLTEPIMQ